MNYQVTLYAADKPAAPGEREAVDYHEQHHIANVVASQVLARIKPLEDEPPPSLAAETEQQLFLVESPEQILGDNVIISPEDPQAIVSTTNGYLQVVNNRLEVRDTLVIDSDVNFRTGNLTFIGKIIVKGSIFAGFKVRARELVVAGSIEGAHIEVEENLIVRGGIIACKEGEVTCGGNLAAKYVENSHLRVRGNIFIEKSVLHSHLMSGGNIVLLHEPGVLVGGSCAARYSVFAQVIGAKWATPTAISLGCCPFTVEELQQLEDAIDSRKGEIEHLETRLADIELFFAQNREAAPAEETARLEEEQELLRARRTIINGQLRELEEKSAVLAAKIQLEKEVNQDCRLYAFETAFPGLEISLKDAELKNDTEQKALFYYEEEREIKIGKL